MPSKKNSNNSTRKQYVKKKVKEANDAINEGLHKSSRILNELEGERKHLEKEITDLNSQYESAGKTIFKFGKKPKMKTLKNQIEQREKELNTINGDIKSVTKELKPYIRKRKSALKSSSTSTSKSKSNSKSNSSSSKSTRRVKFKTNRIVEFDKSDTVDSLLINRKASPKNKTLKKSSK
jgi:predicted  nucleic acid-binding Zn-ribbon protein